MKRLSTLILILFALTYGIAFAQSTGTPAVLGYNTTVGCGSLPTCWQAFTASNPLIGEIAGTPTPPLYPFTMGMAASGLQDGSSIPCPSGDGGALSSTTIDPECQYYAAKGFQTIRLPFSWSSAVPNMLAGDYSVNATYMNHIKNILRQLKLLNIVAILDMHNSMGYDGSHKIGGRSYVPFLGAGAPANIPYSTLANSWGSIVASLEGDTNASFYKAAIGGYEIMNEPFGMSSANDVPNSYQAVITSIRNAEATANIGLNVAIYMDGDAFASAYAYNGNCTQPGDPINFPGGDTAPQQCGGEPYGGWNTGGNADLLTIFDPGNNLVYVGHAYGDWNGEGFYVTIANDFGPVTNTTDGVTNGTATLTSTTSNFTNPSNPIVAGNGCYVRGGTGNISPNNYQVQSVNSATSITFTSGSGLTAGTGASISCGAQAANQGCTISQDSWGCAQHTGDVLNYPVAAINTNTLVKRATPFATFCTTHHLHCILNEDGIPSDDPNWYTTLTNLLNYLKTNGVSYSYWGAGPSFGTNYNLGVYPTYMNQLSGTCQGGGSCANTATIMNTVEEEPQMAWVAAFNTSPAQSTVYFMNGPTRGTATVASSNFNLYYAGNIASGFTITPAQNGGGSTSPTSITCSTGNNCTGTFTVTEPTSDVFRITSTNSASLTDPKTWAANQNLCNPANGIPTVTSCPLAYATVADQFSIAGLAQTDVVNAVSIGRRIYAPYLGPAVTLRRNSDNAIASFYFASDHLGAGLDTTSINTWLSSATPYVVTAYDQSGNNNNLGIIGNQDSPNVPTLADQPQLILNCQNSLPCMNFTGTNRMDLTSNITGITTQTVLTVAAQAYHWMDGAFFHWDYSNIANFDPGAGGGYTAPGDMVQFTGSAGNGGGIREYASDNKFVAIGNTWSYNPSATPASTAGFTYNYVFYPLIDNTAAMRTYLNGVLTGQNDTGPPVAGVATFAGSVMDVLHVDRGGYLPQGTPVSGSAAPLPADPTSVQFPFLTGSGNTGTYTIANNEGTITTPTGIQTNSLWLPYSRINATIGYIRSLAASWIGELSEIVVLKQALSGTNVAAFHADEDSAWNIPTMTGYTFYSPTLAQNIGSQNPPPWAGVNQSGGVGQFGYSCTTTTSGNRSCSNVTNFATPSQGQTYYVSRGMNFIRLPVVWEALQPNLGAGDTTLNSTATALLDTDVSTITASGMDVMIDLHNYGGYNYATAATVGTGNGSTKTFTTTISSALLPMNNCPVGGTAAPISTNYPYLYYTVGGVQYSTGMTSAYYCNGGNPHLWFDFTGNIASGSVDVNTGAFTITFNTAPDNGTPIVVSWTANGNFTTAPTSTYFANFWGQIAQRYASNPKVHFDLMNEPAGENASLEVPPEQAAINAIRAYNTTGYIFPEFGPSFSQCDGYIDGFFQGTISGTTLTVTAMNGGFNAAVFGNSGNGHVYVGDIVVGAGIPANDTVTALGTGTGGVGTYTLSASATVSSAEAMASGQGGPATVSLTDTSNKIVSECHRYLQPGNNDQHGEYTSAPNSGVDIATQVFNGGLTSGLGGLTKFCNDFSCHLLWGEFNASYVPSSYLSLRTAMDFMRTNSSVWDGWTEYSGGPAWGENYIGLVEPREFAGQTGVSVTADRPIMRLLNAEATGHSYNANDQTFTNCYTPYPGFGSTPSCTVTFP